MDIVSELLEKMGDRQSGGVSESFHRELKALLVELVEESTDILGALITSSDGHAWAEVLPGGFDSNRFAAMSSALLALSDTLAREADKGQTQNVLIEGAQGNIYVLHAGKSMSLTVFTSANPSLGLTLAQARRTVEKIVLCAQDAAEKIGR